MDNIIFSPGSRGGLPPIATTAVAGAGAGEIDWTLTEPAAPSGWTIQSAVAVAVPDADPTGIFAGPFVSEVDLATPFAGTLTGLPTGVDCQVGLWLVWEKPDGKLAYSVGTTLQSAAG
jgi:hypothetical protein